MNDSEKLGLAAPFLKTFEDMRGYFGSITWLWDKWLPNGFVTMIAADAGVGKSMLALTVSHIVLSGKEWFDGTPYTADPSKMVLWVECESGEPFHVERALSLGVDLNRIAIPYAKDEADATPSLSKQADRDRIAYTFADSDHALMVLDSLSAATEGDENSTEAGKVVQWLADLAKQTQKPIVVIHHMKKHKLTDASRPPTIHEIRGSSAITQHPRVIWTLDRPDETRPEMLRLAQAKNNLTVRPQNISLKIEGYGRITPTAAKEFTIPKLWTDENTF